MHHAIDDFITLKRAEGRAPATIRDYHRVLLPFADWLNDTAPDALTGRDVISYVAHLRGLGWAPGHVSIHIRNLRSFLRWAFEAGYTQANHAQALKAPGRSARCETPLSGAEIKRMLDTCGADLDGARDRAIIMVLYDCGLRAKELLDLDIVNWQVVMCASLLRIQQSKTGRPRTVPAGKTATAALTDYHALRGKPAGGALFISLRGGDRLGYNGLLKMIKRRGGLAGIERERAHPHILRKSFVTAALNNGLDPERLRVMAGWASLEMLQVYAYSNTGALIEAHARAGPGDRLPGDTAESGDTSAQAEICKSAQA